MCHWCSWSWRCMTCTSDVTFSKSPGWHHSSSLGAPVTGLDAFKAQNEIKYVKQQQITTKRATIIATTRITTNLREGVRSALLSARWKKALGPRGVQPSASSFHSWTGWELFLSLLLLLVLRLFIGAGTFEQSDGLTAFYCRTRHHRCEQYFIA
jgi:hypothetical protein